MPSEANSPVTWRDRRRQMAQQEILAAAWEAAHEHGLGSITLRDVATRVGMQPSSLYTHFASKHAIYDAMFGQAWEIYLKADNALEARLPSAPRAGLKAMARAFFTFCVNHPDRHQLMNTRAIPDFTPSAQSYAPAIRALDNLRTRLRRYGLTDDDAADLYTALLSGLIDQQLANNPGGDRWARLLDRAIDMYANAMGVAPDPDQGTDPDGPRNQHSEAKGTR